MIIIICIITITFITTIDLLLPNDSLSQNKVLSFETYIFRDCLILYEI
jgi:hypothetical protein